MKFCNFHPRTNQTKWKPYLGSANSSYLDWYFCDSNATDIPIRDVSKHGKTEPHYEDGSFNVCNRCNRLLLSGSISRGEKYIFFFTKYVGNIERFRNMFFITGYYEISKICHVPDKFGTRIAIIADDQKFVRIQDALPLYKIIKNKRKNPRHIPKRLDAKNTAQILEHFKSKKNAIRKYVRETELLTVKRNIIQISSAKH